MNIPLALYVHLPWCVRRCPYCDFNAHALHGDLPTDAYVDALLADLAQDAALTAGRTVSSIFIGGGTPSLFPAAAVARILDGAAASLTLAQECEITLEANPGTAEVARFSGFRSAGVNRLSLGIQSFDDAALRALGRIHDAGEGRAAIRMAAAAGFTRINLDLMHGLPGQTVAQALADVAQALEFDTGHVSHYQLTIEPNTPFHHQPPALPDEDTLAAIQEACHDRLEAAGYRRYEVSAWSRPGEACRHNLNYWRFGDYLGVGAGAHGKLTTEGDGVVRTWKQRHPGDYMKARASGAFTAGSARPGTADLSFEFMLNALRLEEGFTDDAFCGLTGNDLDELQTITAAPVAKGLMERRSGHWRPTPLGRRFLNDLQGMFLPRT